MSVKKVNIKDVDITGDSHTTITITGDSLTTRTLEKYNEECPIRKLDAYRYKVKETGQVKHYNHANKRTDYKHNLMKTFNNIRNYINTNITHENIDRVLFITLTFAENMQDAQLAYQAYKNFFERFKRFCKDKDLEIPEYISVIEPQRRGSFHFHVLLIYEEEPPYIENETLTNLWGNGFTFIKKMSGSVNNVGNYLVAYMSDVIVDDNDEEVVIADKNKSSIKKGERLNYYPRGIHILRHSKGLKKPEVVHTTYSTAMNLIEHYSNEYQKTYETAVQFEDENTKYANAIVKKHFQKITGEQTTFEASKEFGVEF